MCERADNSCREEKLGCSGCEYNKQTYLNSNILEIQAKLIFKKIEKLLE